MLFYGNRRRKDLPVPVVDMHAHIYPDKIAQRATESVGLFYDIPMSAHEGSVACLMELCADSDISHSVACSVAVKPQTVAPINDFIAQSCSALPRLRGLAAMHQDFEDPQTELNRAGELGLLGVKLHPDTQCVDMDDPRLMHVYEICERMGLALLVHCGDYRYDYSHPSRMKRILHEFPQLKVCAAHFGGWSVQDLALEYLEDEHCFLDMSSSMKFLGLRRTRELCELYGSDRILFGSDFPMWNPVSELERFRSIGFSESDMERMCWRNAERWLGIDIG